MKRITLIDALRGIVLIGICLVHAMQHFGGMPMQAEPPFPWVGSVDEILNWIVRYFIMGKFFIIFSFLFGLSFFIQMDRAAQKGIDFRARFLWRLTILFIIGVVHSAICHLDILIIYAILGVPLVLMYRLPNKILITIAAFFLMGGAQLTTLGYNAITNPPQREVTTAMIERRQQTRTLVLTGTLSENIQSNVTERLKSKFNFQFGAYGRGYITMGFFILGLLAGRLRLFHNLDRYQSRLYRMGGIAFVLLLALYAIQPYLPQGNDVLAWASMQVANIINLLSAYLWVVVILWLYQKEAVQNAFTKIVSYGQMGLTNYIVQSVAGVFIFYGFGLGLETQIGTFFSILICLGYTILQIQASYYWLKIFCYGPVEWLWRSATYQKWQPLRRESKEQFYETGKAI